MNPCPTPRFPMKSAMLVAALALAYPQSGHSAAGVAQFASGDVNVRRGGNLIAVAKGRDLESGDSITTGSGGRVQIKFSDGGYVALQPNSQFDITKYADANDPQRDSFLVNFARGSMRAITGLIGKRNRENYKVQTSTATVGIRGSGFSAGYNADGSLAITSELGEIEVCTSGGCVRLTVGETALVISNNEPPVRSLVRANLPTPAPRQDVVIAGNQVTAGGVSALISKPVVETVSSPWAVSVTTSQTTVGSPNQLLGNNYLASAAAVPVTLAAAPQAYAQAAISSTADTLTSAQLESFGGLTKLNEFTARDGNDISFTVKRTTSGSYSSVGATSDADFLGWGHWAASSFSGGYTGSSNASMDHLHYVVGKPSTDTQMAALNGMTGSYSFLGGTATFRPTGYGGGSVIAGTVAGNGALTAYFSSGSASWSGSVKTTFNSTTLTLDLGGMSTGAKVTCGNVGTLAGMFTGSAANRLGLVFNQYNSGSALGAGSVNGSAAFGRTSLTGP